MHRIISFTLLLSNHKSRDVSLYLFMIFIVSCSGEKTESYTYNLGQYETDILYLSYPGVNS